MEIKFKSLKYQENAVQAVVQCFKGQPKSAVFSYRRDLGIQKPTIPEFQTALFDTMPSEKKEKNSEMGFANAPIQDMDLVLKNIQAVQTASGLNKSLTLVTEDKDKDKGKNRNLTSSPLNLDVEMETGTGKTYCYIRTMFELNKQYGWSKFIIVVPSIAIREGVAKSMSMMAGHFQEQYGKKARFFIYDSKSLHNLDSFSSTADISVMIINVQAFNATGKDNRRIYEELDEFQSRRPIDVIAKNRPILILDEPQKMQADKTLESLSNFKPLFILRYSATHKRQYNLVHRLDALDAYNQKLVKKISVKGIEVKGLSGTHEYLYLENISVSKSAPVAHLEIEVETQKGFRRQIRKVQKGDNLYTLSNNAEQYADRYVVVEIDARAGFVEFENGKKIHIGEALGNVDEKTMRTIQIRETIRAHLDKEHALFHLGIKVLSLFFIDEVAKYRVYDENGTALNGEYAEIFKHEYEAQVAHCLAVLDLEEDPYRDYLRSIDVDKTHNGYFAVDKKTKHFADPSIDKKSEEQLSNDSDAYDLILKDKERLLSFEEPTRFIFSHSALREGWDNPNVFVICTLKHSDNSISRRQEVGRGLRLAVNSKGERMDANYFGAEGEVHKLNNLTVVTNESYKDFVSKLQTEIRESLQSRPTQATPEYFSNKIFTLSDGTKKTISLEEAKQIHKYLIRNNYIDDNDQILPNYHEAKANGKLATLPENLESIQQHVFKLIDGIFDPKAVEEMMEDANKNQPNPINADNLNRKEFQILWSKINQKAVFTVELDSNKLIKDVVKEIDKVAMERNNKFVETLSYTVSGSTQKDEISLEALEDKQTFGKVKTERLEANISAYSSVRYDLLGEIAEQTNLTRRTVAKILQGINAAIFGQFKHNPEAFIREISQIINHQQAQMLLQHLKYSLTEQRYEQNEVFISNDVSRKALKLEKHVFEYAATDSVIESKFALALDGAKEVVVYAKLPDRFQIPTPFGAYNPDWAIAFDANEVKQIYFVAETKGSIDTSQLRAQEYNKIQSAHKFFNTLNEKQNSDNTKVQYHVVDSFEQLRKMLFIVN